MSSTSTRCTARTRVGRAGAALALALSTVAHGQVASEAALDLEEARIYVAVKARQPLGDFILDTGSAGALLDVETARVARLDGAGTTDQSGAGTARFQVATAGPITLDVAGAPIALRSPDVGAIGDRLSPHVGRRVAGIIGRPLFERYTVDIDFDHRLLRLSTPRAKADDRGAIVIPFRRDDGVPIAIGRITLPDGTDLPLRLLLDLGAKSTLLVAEPFAREHGLTARFARSVVMPLGAGIGGETRYAFTRLPRLSIGDAALDQAVIGLSVGGTLRGGYYDALLGLGFFQNYNLTIDYRRNVFVLRPRAHAEALPLDRSGLYLVADDPAFRHFVVRNVVAGSPAEAAGLRPGDVIAAVDRVTAKQLTLARVRAILATPGTRTVRVDALRGSDTITADVALEDLI